jgi:hypothetical protein
LVCLWAVRVRYAGEIRVICCELEWEPGDERDLPDELGHLLVLTNPNFVQVNDYYTGSERGD